MKPKPITAGWITGRIKSPALPKPVMPRAADAGRPLGKNADIIGKTVLGRGVLPPTGERNTFLRFSAF